MTNRPVQTYTKQTLSMTNTTTKFLVVANSHHVLSAHDTREEAVAALPSMHEVECGRWSSIWVVAPGETKTGEYCQWNPFTAAEQAAWDAAEAEDLKAYFWIKQ